MYPNIFRAAGDPRPYWSACPFLTNVFFSCGDNVHTSGMVLASFEIFMAFFCGRSWGGRGCGGGVLSKIIKSHFMFSLSVMLFPTYLEKSIFWGRGSGGGDIDMRAGGREGRVC